MIPKKVRSARVHEHVRNCACVIVCVCVCVRECAGVCVCACVLRVCAYKCMCVLHVVPYFV